MTGQRPDPQRQHLRRRPTATTSTTRRARLLQSTISSLNVPFYALTVSVTPTKVLEMARDAGIDYMWNDDRERQDLRQART